MASDAFRRELQREVQRWYVNGLISQEQLQALVEQYQLTDLETAARDRFVMILLGLGSLLVGIGAITFVAANWQALSQTVKAGLLLMVMLIADLSGFTLIHQISPDNRWQRLGQALLLLGALLLGANLALMGQIVHTSDTRYELCAVWALGVLALAYGTRLSFLGMLALLLLGIGYWSALWDMAWLQTVFLGVWTLQGMPLLVTALFLPLAYYCRSSALFTLTAIASTSALFVLVLDVGRTLPAAIQALLLVMPYGLLWAYDDTLWGWIVKRMPFQLTQPFRTPAPADDSRPFQPLARGLMLFALSVFYWASSFQDAWLNSPSQVFLAGNFQWQASWPAVLALLTYTLWTVGAWGYLGWRPGRPWRLDTLSGTILVFLWITASVFFWTLAVGPIPIIATVVFNTLLTLTSLGLMREGLGEGARLPFWWGLIILALQILSRVLEYETGLLLKSLVFMLCGVSIIVMGLWFERYVRTLQRRAG